MGIILSSVSSIANYVIRELQQDDLKSSISNELCGLLNVHQSMIEQIYISPLKSFKDFIANNMYSDAIRSLMDLSNRDATPKVNYILALALFLNGNAELAKEKLEKAISMNPFMDCFQKFLSDNYKCMTPSSEWTSQPFTITDTFANKAFRRMGIEVNEGIIKTEVITSGGDVFYLFKTENDVKYGLLNLSNGNSIWQKYEENVNYTDYKIITCTPDYSVIRIGCNYYFYNRHSSCVTTYSNNAFELLFSTKSELRHVFKFLAEETIDECSRIINLPTLSNRELSIIPIKYKKHKYWKTDGNHPHPGIDFDPVIYWAMNVELRLR